MRIALCFTILLAISSITTAQKKMSDAEFDGLRGKVKKVLTYDSDIEVKNGKIVKTPRKLEFAAEYDEIGNMTQSVLYALGDKRSFSFIDGEKTSKTERIEVPGLQVFTGVAVGTQSSNPVVRDPRFNDRYKYEFDAQGRITEERRYGNDGKLHSHWNYKYDDKGHLVEESTFHGGSMRDEKTISKFDAAGNVVERQFIGRTPDDSLTTHRFSGYKFDPKGNWIERTQTTIYYKNGNRKEIKRFHFERLVISTKRRLGWVHPAILRSPKDRIRTGEA
jgi:hypothetical protein